MAQATTEQVDNTSTEPLQDKLSKQRQIRETGRSVLTWPRAINEVFPGGAGIGLGGSPVAAGGDQGLRAVQNAIGGS